MESGFTRDGLSQMAAGALSARGLLDVVRFAFQRRQVIRLRLALKVLRKKSGVRCRESGVGDFNYALRGPQHSASQRPNASWSDEGNHVLSPTGTLKTERNTGEKGPT